MSTAAEWHFLKNGTQQGPVTAAQLKQLASAGSLLPSDMIWKNGLPNWVPASSVKGLFAASPQVAQAKPSPAPMQAASPPRRPEEGQWDDYDDAPPRRREPRPTYDNSGRFKFDGGPGGFFVNYLLMLLIFICTAGFGFPWAVCRYLRWKCHHTLIEGRRLKFVGVGSDLFWPYFRWQLAWAFTGGIFMIWMVPKMNRWVTENTDFDDGDDRRR